MQEHPVHGANLLTRYKDFARGAAIVRGHHERWDGQGYPDGLKGAEIPFGARVIAVADAYDAMTSDRPYRSGMTHAMAASILAAGSGSQWDEELVRAFLAVPKTRVTDAERPVPSEGLQPLSAPLARAI